MVNDLLSLPLSERLELVQMLWDSIASEQVGPPLSDEDKALINQRLEALQKDRNPGDDAEAVLNDLERSL
jgi:putative addiction module component (TIGR02574 family)